VDERPDRTPDPADQWAEWKLTEREEAVRWQRLVGEGLRLLPEVKAWLQEWDEDEPELAAKSDLARWGPGNVGIEITSKMLHLDGFPRYLDGDLWPRVLAFVELVEDLLALLEAERDEDDEDLTTLGSFADAEIICGFTRNRGGLVRLLPWIGPRTAAAARREIEVHSQSRRFGVENVDWSSASSDYSPLQLVPAELRPLDRP
jgi:hypothetical protein